ncbi:MAG: hypothetical protein IKG30_12685 [Clostridiales bacterium]|nr:hypothetical protein [Clostridiales bacterium]
MSVFGLMTVLGLIIVAFGILAILITYVFAPAASRKSDHHVSGIPVVGGILLVIGFLCTPWKYLALLGLIEFLFVFIPLAPELLEMAKDFKNWTPPATLDGTPVTFTKYKNRYSEIKGKELPGDGYEVKGIVRYVITKTYSGFNLYGLDMASNVVICQSYPSVEECKENASGAVRNRWKKMEKHIN